MKTGRGGTEVFLEFYSATVSKFNYVWT